MPARRRAILSSSGATAVQHSAPAWSRSARSRESIRPRHPGSQRVVDVGNLRLAHPHLAAVLSPRLPPRRRSSACWPSCRDGPRTCGSSTGSRPCPPRPLPDCYRRRMRAFVVAVMLSAACGPPVAERGEPRAPEPETPLAESAESEPLEDTTTEVDFDDEVVDRQTAIEAQPRRPPVGAFELCGAKCKDDVELKSSFDDEPEPRPPSARDRRRARRAARRARR